MGFVVNLMLLQQWKNFANRSRTDEVTAIVRVAPFFLNHGVLSYTSCLLFLLQSLHLTTSSKLEKKRRKFPQTGRLLRTAISAVCQNYTRRPSCLTAMLARLRHTSSAWSNSVDCHPQSSQNSVSFFHGLDPIGNTAACRSSTAGLFAEVWKMVRQMLRAAPDEK